jgi:protein phosphatase
MVRRGLLSPADAAQHVYRHVVTNVVGGTLDSVQVDVQEFDLQGEDILLLCTDGLTDMLANDRIAAILQAERDPGVACDRLVDEALKQGGRDNITAIVTHLDAS